MNSSKASMLRVAALCAVTLLAPRGLLAHCDGMDGPVIKAAQKALATGNVNLVLIWVRTTDEPEIRAAFEKTQAVRKLSPGAKDLADTYFFETLVRLHRAGEGEPYTGLKPAGRDLGPAIPAGDRAIDTGSVEPLLKALTDEVRNGVAARFEELRGKRSFRSDDLDAGREYVKAYVEFMHYVEGVYQASTNPGHGHAEEAEGDGAPSAHKR